MRIRITIEQLNELTDEKKERLREWWKPSEGDWYADWNEFAHKYKESLYFVVEEDRYYSNEPSKENTDLPLLSIGQMAHFLYEETNDWGIHYNDSGVCFYVYLSWSLDTAAPDRQWMNDELCDALWEAVKHVL